jgi:hypothetical protein
MAAYSKDYKAVILVLDSHCPYFKDKAAAKEFKEYVEYIAGILDSPAVIEEINQNKIFINDFQEAFTPLKKLKNLSKRLCLSDYGLTKISLKDKLLFDEYFSKTDPSISSFSFVATYIWSGILNILWKEIKGSLCVFAGNDRDYFLLLPPIDAVFSRRAVKEAFEILQLLNKGGMDTIKIENIPQKYCKEFAQLGLVLKPHPPEYIYSRRALSELRGEAFKTKRKSVNNFIKRYKYICRPMSKDDAIGCLDLYKRWALHRLKTNKDDYYRFLIEDSYFAQKIGLHNFDNLKLKGLVVETDGIIKGYTAGYALNKDTFVILFETTDLDIKGLAQFIFKEFCSQLSEYKYINAMSDSGLENLKKTKESYRPIKKISLFRS